MSLRPSHSGFEPRTRDPERRDFFDLRRRLSEIERNGGGGGGGLVIEGTIPTVGPPTDAQVPPAGRDEGDIWIDSNGDGWSWNGTSWVNIGPIKGPPGSTGPPGPQGPTGPQGVPGETGPMGGSTSLFEYNYATGTAPPPSAGTFRSDGATAATSTTIWIHRLDITDADRKPFFMAATIGTEFFIQDVNDSGNWARFHLTGVPIDNGNYVTYPVAYDTGDGVGLVGNMRALIGIIVPGPQGPTGPQGPIGPDEVWVGPDDPIGTVPTIDLWYDDDADEGLASAAPGRVLAIDSLGGLVWVEPEALVFGDQDAQIAQFDAADGTLRLRQVSVPNDYGQIGYSIADKGLYLRAALGSTPVAIVAIDEDGVSARDGAGAAFIATQDDHVMTRKASPRGLVAWKAGSGSHALTTSNTTIFTIAVSLVAGRAYLLEWEVRALAGAGTNAYHFGGSASPAISGLTIDTYMNAANNYGSIAWRSLVRPTISQTYTFTITANMTNGTGTIWTDSGPTIRVIDIGLAVASS